MIDRGIMAKVDQMIPALSMQNSGQIGNNCIFVVHFELEVSHVTLISICVGNFLRQTVGRPLLMNLVSLRDLRLDGWRFSIIST